MIKFFRRIRQRLLSENKFSKYLFYAIGEIFLVVIGILLALSINNWNSTRQTQLSNRLYLTNMLNDLEATKKRLNGVVYEGFVKWPSMQEAVKACDTLLNLSYHGFKKEHSEIFLNNKINSGNSLLNVSDNTYQEMLNTGKIYTLKSDSLTKAITFYYKMCQREESYNRTNSEHVYDGLDRIKDGFGKIRLDYELNSNDFDLNDYPFFFDETSKQYKDFQIGLYAMLEGQRNNMNKMLMVIEQTDSLQNIIKGHLMLNY